MKRLHYVFFLCIIFSCIFIVTNAPLPGYESQKQWINLAAGEDKHTEVPPVKNQTAVAIPSSGKTFTNSIGMKFVLIQKGTFMMGSPSNEPKRDKDEIEHRVTISRPFYLQTTEVTQGQWKAIMGDNPSLFKDCGDNCPVERISWDSAQKFIQELNRKEGTDKYRLPTEAEWEYACRAGTTTPYNTGDCISTNQANFDGRSPLPDCPEGDCIGKTMKVGSFAPNPWGLYDMHGNVYEWCQDWCVDYSGEHVTDPIAPPSGWRGGLRVLRGGSCLNYARRLRSAYRYRHFPQNWDCTFGFRVARDY
jgi:formylglycine-generating enzyme required for sulfatase activity